MTRASHILTEFKTARGSSGRGDPWTLAEQYMRDILRKQGFLPPKYPKAEQYFRVILSFIKRNYAPDITPRDVFMGQGTSNYGFVEIEFPSGTSAYLVLLKKLPGIVELRLNAPNKIHQVARWDLKATKSLSTWLSVEMVRKIIKEG